MRFVGERDRPIEEQRGYVAHAKRLGDVVIRKDDGDLMLLCEGAQELAQARCTGGVDASEWLVADERFGLACDRTGNLETSTLAPAASMSRTSPSATR